MSAGESFHGLSLLELRAMMSGQIEIVFRIIGLLRLMWWRGLSSDQATKHSVPEIEDRL
jgi:hypothetical protein